VCFSFPLFLIQYTAVARWIYIAFTMVLLSKDMEEVAYHQGTHCTLAVSLGSVRQVFKEGPTALIQIKIGKSQDYTPAPHNLSHNT